MVVLFLWLLLTAPVSAATPHERSVLRRINAVRVDHGLHALRPRAELATSARAWSRYLALHGTLFHGNFTERMQDYGFVARRTSEVIQYRCDPNGTTAAELVNAWFASPPHRRVLLDGRLTDAGVGIAVTAQDPCTYATVDLATPKNPIAPVNGNGCFVPACNQGLVDFGRIEAI